MQVTKHTSEGSTLALKCRGDITRSPKQGYQWPHKKDLCPPQILKKTFTTLSTDRKSLSLSKLWIELTLTNFKISWGTSCTVPKYRAAVDYTPRSRAPRNLPRCTANSDTCEAVANSYPDSATANSYLATTST